MPKTGMSPAQIRAKATDIAVQQMRRYGFEKVTLVGIAKELGVSHAALYMHFTDKGALLDAVSERWLRLIEATLAPISQKNKDPIAGIHEWFSRLHQIKRDRVRKDPELYKSFHAASKLQKPFYREHLANMRGQLEEMVKGAVSEKKLTKQSIDTSVTLLLEATTGFHNPTLVEQHSHEKRENLLRQVLDTVIDGLR
jgi:AcrR family transcriptional regulator